MCSVSLILFFLFIFTFYNFTLFSNNAYIYKNCIIYLHFLFYSNHIYLVCYYLCTCIKFYLFLWIFFYFTMYFYYVFNFTFLNVFLYIFLIMHNATYSLNMWNCALCNAKHFKLTSLHCLIHKVGQLWK